MKKNYLKSSLVALGLLLSLNFYGQNQIEKCGSAILHNQMMNDPSYAQKMSEFELYVKTQSSSNTPKVAAQYRIPVVVHVLHKGEAVGVGTNVSDADIRAAIKELNNRYRKTAGTAGAGNGVDMEIEFALAVRNPSGQCTNGINRVSMTGNATYMASGVRSTTTNGITDAQVKAVTSWDRTKYYNIYLVSEIDNNEGGAGVQGYAYFASSHGTSVDGAVVMASNFTSGTSMTTTHELGHALNLYHTFEGDGSGANCPATTNGCGSNAGDCCADTPPHRRSQSDCNTTGTNSCNGNSSNTLFVRNYMDYSSDGCMNMFTANQKTRALAACSGSRASFFASSNLALVPVAAPVVDFSASSAAICSGQSVTFTDLSACVPNTFLPETNWSNITFSWTFTNGGTVLTSTLQNPTMSFTVAGSYDVTLTVTTATGSNTLTKPGFVILAGNLTNACTPTSTNAGNFGQTISKVVFNTLSNTTDDLTNVAYTNFACSDNTIVQAGNTYPISITGNAGPTGAERFEVYIDYNNNGVFANPGELVHSGSIAAGSQTALNTQTLTANVTIPTTAVTNTFLRMRVLADATAITANKRTCTSAFSIGDVEDYGIYIQSNAPTAPVANFTANNQVVCAGQSVQFTSTSTGNPTSYSWSFTGGTPATSTSQNPTVTYPSPGTYAVSLTATNAQGNNTNNQTSYITVSSNTGLSLPLTEGFTGTTFPPTGWTIINTDNGDTTWRRSATVGFAPTAGNSMIFMNYLVNDTGNQDEMRTPKLDLSGYTSAQVTFDVAYAAYNTANTDGLQVLISTDCGTTWTSVYNKTGTTVASGNLPTAAATTSAFVPTSSQWRTETINLNTYVGNSGAILAFRNLADYGNNLYIDNINITGTGTPTQPTASFTSTPTATVCTGQTVQYTSTSTGIPTSYSWTFPGGTPATSTQQNPTVTYSTSGTYNASLTVTNSIGSNTSNQTNYITVNATPTAPTTTPANRCGTGTLSLSATASAGTLSWFAAATGGTALGTGATFTTPSISTTTTYYVSSTASGCSSARTAVVATINPVPTVTSPGNKTVCLGSPVAAISFAGSSSSSTYAWTNSNANLGLAASGNGNIASFTPTTTGTSTVSVTPTLNGCPGTAVTFTITVNALPTVTLGTLASVCDNAPSFALTGGSPAGGTYSGTGVSNNNFNPATAGAGTFPITYTATQNGCSNTATSNITVDPCASIDEVLSKLIIVYPNPTSGLMTIKDIPLDKVSKMEMI
ncbi:MAG: PKD domain-containing protein, partial [Crocinitomicaceae bacterium]|nr:PKD domain-containing protein [Crocinitomicaceae bacterium]